MRVFLCLVIGVMCPVCISLSVWNCIWVAIINGVHFSVSVVLNVGTCVRILSHILAWNYQLLVHGNPNLVYCLSTISHSITQVIIFLNTYLTPKSSTTKENNMEFHLCCHVPGVYMHCKCPLGFKRSVVRSFYRRPDWVNPYMPL